MYIFHNYSVIIIILKIMCLGDMKNNCRENRRVNTKDRSVRLPIMILLYSKNIQNLFIEYLK